MANVNVKVGYTVDKTGLNELKKQLTDIRVEAANAKLTGKLTEDLEKASIAAGKLEDALDISWNSKLNQLNLSKFQETIRKAGTTVDGLMTSLSKGPASAQMAFENLTRNIATTNLQLKTSSQLLDKFAVTFKNTVRYGISSSIFNNLSNSIQKAYDYTKDLDTSLNDIRIVSDKSADEMERFAINANKAAKSLGKSTLDYTRASTIYYQQGLSDEEVKARTEVTLKAANVTGQASAEVSEQLTSIWNGYKVTAEEAELYIDKVAAVAATTAADLEELSTGMSKVASAANLMGVDIDQLNAQLATIVSVTRQAPESVGVALKTIYARMSDIKSGLDDETTLGNYTEKMAQYGINVLNANGELRDMGEVIEEIGNKWQSMSREQQVALAQTMAGTRQYNNLLSLFENWDMYNDALKTSQEAAGSLQHQQDIYMESTEAHLQQMRTEAQRTYDIVFNQDTINTFADALTGALKQFNDYISGIGGGMNALLSLGAQIANLYRKQIGESLVRSADNLKKYWDENKRGVEVIQNLRDTVQKSRDESLANQIGSGGKSYEAEYSETYKQNTDEVLNTVEQAYKVRKGLTDVQLNEIQNEAKKLAQLKDEEAYYKAIRDYAEQEYSITDSVSAKQGVEAETKSLEYLSEVYTKIKTTNEEINELHIQAGNTVEGKAAIEDAEAQKRIEAQTLLNSLKNDEYISEVQTTQLEQMQASIENGEQLTETQLNELDKIKISLATQHNNQLRENKDILEAILRDENGITEEKRRQINATQANISNTLETGKKNAIASTGVQYASAAIQGLTALTGALTAFTKENATGADKANAAWQGVFGVGSAIANAILPGSGFIVQGLGAVGKGILEATGLWEGFEDLFKSSKEKLAEIDEEIKKIKKDIQESEDKYQSNASGIQYFEDIKERFEYLQDLAQKGLLPDDLRTEYESYLKKVQEYNEDALITYDDQGKMISANTKLMEETINKLKEENKQIRAMTYSQDNWNKATKEYESKYEAKYAYQDIKNKSKQQVAFGKYLNPMADTNAGKYFADKEAFTPSLDDVVKNYDDVIEKGQAEFDKYIDKIFKQYTGYSTKEFEKLSAEEKKLVDTTNQDMWMEIQYAVDYLNYWEEHIKKAKSEFQAETFTQNLKPELDKTLILNDLKYDPANQSFYDSFTELGFTNADELITNYLQGIEDGLSVEDYKTGIYEKVRNQLLNFEKDVTLIFKDIPTLMDLYQNVLGIEGETSQEFENKKIEAINAFLAEITDKTDYEKIKPYLTKMFDLEYLDTHWDEKSKRAYVGNQEGTTNLVTKGEQRARNIGEILSSYYDTSTSRQFGYDEEQKKKFKEQIEQYLQDTLDETQLENLDTTKLTESFNKKLYNAFDPSTGQLKEGFSLDEILQSAINEQTNTTSSSISKTISSMGELDSDVNKDELKEYAQHLTEIADQSNLVSDQLKKNADAATRVANAVMRMNNGIEDLKENLDGWKDVLKKSDKASQEYSDAISGLREATADLLDVEAGDLSEAFLTNAKNLDLLTKAAKGDEKAIDDLRASLVQDIVLNIALENNINQDKINEIKSELDSLRNYDDIKIGATIDTSKMAGAEADFLNTCQKIISDAGMTTEQANAFFDKMGFQAQYKTEVKDVEQKVPKYVTTKQITKWDKGEPVEWTESSYQNGFDTFTGKMEVPAMAVSADGTETPIIKTLTKTSGFGSGALNNYSSKNPGSSGKSGGGGGGGSKEPNKMDPLEKEVDRYHDVDIQLKQIKTDMDKLEKQKKKLFGADLIANLNKQLKLLDKQIDTTHDKIKIAEDEAYNTENGLQKKLSEQGVLFNADNTIANYTEIYTAKLKYVNDLITQYNHLGADAQENFQKNILDPAKKDFDKFTEQLERYDTVVTELIPSLEADIQAAVDEKIDLQIEKFDMEIEIRLDLAEAERDWNEFKKKIIDGIEDDDILGNAMAKLVDFSSYYKEDNTGIVQALRKQVDNTLAELNAMDTNGWSNVYGDNRTAALDDLKKYYEELMSNLTDVLELQKEIHESYIDMMDEAQEKFDEQIETYEMISDLIEHDMEVISLVYGEQSYGQLAKYYDKQQQNFNSQLDFQRQQADFWRQQLDTLEEGSDEWENAREKWADAVQSMNDLIEESIQNLQDKYLNAINLIFQNLNNKITDNLGLEYIEEEWNLINKNADQYLDTINSLYEVQKLEGKYLDALDQTDSISAQRQLKKIMDEELADLRERDKLTQYDIERANKKYEIALKQIALQEAQQNKSKMRLRRDSQGNYRYEYTADGDQIGQLQDELNDMYNSLYNFDKARYQDNLNQMYDVWVEFQEKMAEAAQINDPVARSERELLLQTQYEQLINGLTEQNTTVRNNLHESAFDDLSRLYDIDVANFQNMSDEEKDVLMGDLLPYWESGVQHMTDVFAGEGGFLGVCKDAFDQLHDATKDYEDGLDELENTGRIDFESIGEGIDENINRTQQLISDNTELINSYEQELTAIGNVIAQLDDLVNKYNAAKDAAIAATKAAYEYWSEQQRQAAAAAGNANGGSGSGNGNSGSGSGSSGSGSGGGAGSALGGDGNLIVGETATYSGRYYYDSYGSSPTGSKYSGVANGIVVDRITNNPYGIHIHSADGRYRDLGWVKKSQLSGYDTGGYTGEWGSDGRLALLHQKELVLNKEDTANMLNAISIMRNITNMLGSSVLGKLAAATAGGLGTEVGGDVLEQNVHIDAQFPNVKDSREIEEALNNLVNMASMRANRR